MQLINLLCLSKTRALILFSMKLVNYLLTFFQHIWQCNWDIVMAYHSALSIIRGNSLSIIEMDTPRLASQASHGVSMSISALVISKLATVWHLFLSSFASCTILLDRVISRMDPPDQILLDAWTQFPHLVTCIVKCEWMVHNCFKFAWHDIKWIWLFNIKYSRWSRI